MGALIEPHYPKAGKGRKPYGLSTMLRIYFMQQWFGYSDAGMEEALHDIPLLRGFSGLDAGVDTMPDETTILNFRQGTMVDATFDCCAILYKESRR